MKRPNMETILLVDDEAAVLAVVREMLEGKGYQILDAPNAEEAVRVASNYSGPIHLLLTDIVMPGASGHELAQQLSLQRPEMKILYMSAFTLVMGQQQFSEAESGLKRDAPTILKPFTVERLTEKVQDVLAARPRSPFDRPSDPWRNV
jgi:two-component system cell cycle sensor histidine kinase/response regulator CckA